MKLKAWARYLPISSAIVVVAAVAFGRAPGLQASADKLSDQQIGSDDSSPQLRPAIVADPKPAVDNGVNASGSQGSALNADAGIGPVLRPSVDATEGSGQLKLLSPTGAKESPQALPQLHDPPQLKMPMLQRANQVIFNMHMVTPTLIRGSQPSVQALQLLKNAGVKTIVNLRNEEVLIKQESAQARALGLNYISIPLTHFNRPSDLAVASFLSAVNDPANQPVYVHCREGQDRTGTMCAIYRIGQQHWSFNQAYQEMLSLGFKPILLQLSATVYDYSTKPSMPNASISKPSSPNPLSPNALQSLFQEVRNGFAKLIP